MAQLSVVAYSYLTAITVAQEATRQIRIFGV